MEVQPVDLSQTISAYSSIKELEHAMPQQQSISALMSTVEGQKLKKINDDLATVPISVQIFPVLINDVPWGYHG